MNIRKYKETDKEAIVHLLKLNTPEFFDPTEEEDLRKYLMEEVEEYFVVEEDNEIIGAGGINYFPQERTARLSWDFVHPYSQGEGIGKKLSEHRIQILKQRKDVDFIVVRTTQLTYGFYEKMGFKLKKVEKDFWALDLDLYYMILKVAN